MVFKNVKLKLYSNQKNHYKNNKTHTNRYNNTDISKLEEGT